MRTLKNIFRRKVRAFLTILGIVIGVFALVVMGAMAEKLTLLVDGGTEYYQGKATVSAKNSMGGFMSKPLSVDLIEEIEALPGVAKAQGEIAMSLEEEMSALNMGPPPMIIGTDLRGDHLEKFEITMTAGRELEPGDSGQVVIGSDLVKKLKAEVGKDVKVRGRSFEVVGIMEKTLTAPDTTVVMPLADAQEIYHGDLAPIVRASLEPSEILTSVTAFAKEGIDPNRMAKNIEKRVEGVDAMGPEAFERQIGQSVAMFTSIITLIGLIALLVGGLSVINTMSMAIAERTREIGIRKAIGASGGALMRQFLAESGTVGLIGGLLGLAIGWVFTVAMNNAGNEAGTALFLVTSRLAVGSVSFALVLGVLGGLLPAWRASRLDPVAALRYE
jgi:putative ABC transport system permease protein